MICVDCKHSKFIDIEEGVSNLYCFKFKQVVVVLNKCVNSKRFAQEERAKKIYLENYQVLPITLIAKKIGWTVNKLHYFIDAAFLPKVSRQIRKAKGILNK